MSILFCVSGHAVLRPTQPTSYTCSTVFISRVALWGPDPSETHSPSSASPLTEIPEWIIDTLVGTYPDTKGASYLASSQHHVFDQPGRCVKPGLVPDPCRRA